MGTERTTKRKADKDVNLERITKRKTRSATPNNYERNVNKDV